MNENAVYGFQIPALVAEIFKFENCVKYANEMTVDLNFDFIDFATVKQHRGRRWNRTCVPIDINFFNTHPATRKVDRNTGNYVPYFSFW